MKTTLTILALLLLMQTAASTADMRGCFTRTYDRAHLARHPDQRITRVKLHVYPSPDNDPNSDRDETWFEVNFWVRGKDKPLWSAGRCRWEKEMAAQSPEGTREKFFWYCDAYECGAHGGLNLVPRARDATMYFNGVTVEADCAADLWFTGGKDDRVFRLNRVDDAACKKIAKQDD